MDVTDVDVELFSDTDVVEFSVCVADVDVMYTVEVVIMVVVVVVVVGPASCVVALLCSTVLLFNDVTFLDVVTSGVTFCTDVVVDVVDVLVPSVRTGSKDRTVTKHRTE